jgi:hypothetical protein
VNLAYANAEQININNNNTPADNTQAQNNCGNPVNTNQGDNQRPGTYYSSNPGGGTDTIYTTGDKTPYIIDNNNCNNNIPLVQPYIYGVPNSRPRGR